MASTPSPAKVALGHAIRVLRQRQEISQEDLALQGQLQRKTIYQLEAARIDPRFTTLLRVAAALDVRVGDLLNLADDLAGPGAVTNGRDGPGSR